MRRLLTNDGVTLGTAPAPVQTRLLVQNLHTHTRRHTSWASHTLTKHVPHLFKIFILTPGPHDTRSNLFTPGGPISFMATLSLDVDETTNQHGRAARLQEMEPSPGAPPSRSPLIRNGALRFEFTETRHRNKDLQLQEIKLYESLNATKSLRIRHISNPGGWSPTKQLPLRLHDGDTSSEFSKFVDLNMSTSGKSILDIVLHERVHVAAYELFTANDNPGRDPMGWSLYSLSHDWRQSSWRCVHTVAGVVPPETRFASYGRFSTESASHSTNHLWHARIFPADPRWWPPSPSVPPSLAPAHPPASQTAESTPLTLPSLLRASELSWHRRYDHNEWQTLRSHVSADEQFNDHLDCTLRAVLAASNQRTSQSSRLRITVVGGSFTLGSGLAPGARNWIHMLRDWLDDALHPAGISVEVKSAALGAVDSAIVAACMRDQIGVGDSDLFFWDFCTNDGFTHLNATTVEDVVQQAIGERLRAPERQNERDGRLQPSIFLVCSPNNAWWNGKPKWQTGHIVRTTAQHYHTAFVDAANALSPYAALVKEFANTSVATELPTWLHDPIASDDNHAGSSAHRLVCDLIAQQLSASLQRLQPRGEGGQRTSRPFLKLNEDRGARCVYPHWPRQRAFPSTLEGGLAGVLGDYRPSCQTNFWCPAVTIFNRSAYWNRSTPCRPMPSAASSAWATVEGRHLSSCITSLPGADDSKICIDLPNGMRIGRSGAIVHAQPDSGMLRASASSVWFNNARGRIARFEEFVDMDTSQVRWGHHQLLEATNLSFGGAVAANRTLCLSPVVGTREVHLCGMWWTSKPLALLSNA